MRLLSLKIQNFKGLKEFTLEPLGRNVNIYGDNATGKTTLYDAFCWLLFDKDSSGAKEFSIKPLSANGEPIHHLETQVEGRFEIGGKTITLARRFYERWTKKRGSANAEFSGHTTDHFVDGVSVTAGEYKTRIAQFIDEATFRLLTDPLYFNEHLHWQERREILLAVCGDVPDEAVIASHPDLAKLPEILGDRKPDDHRKVLEARRKEINQELDRIPVRIAEVQMSLPAAVEDPARLAEDIAALRARVAEKRAELARIENGGEIAEKQKLLARAEAELLKIGTRERGRILDQTAAKRAAQDAIRQKIQELQNQIETIDLSSEQELENNLVTLRNQWYEIDARQWAGSDVCPTCGQALPPEQIEAAKANFNRQKAEDLERITAAGRELKAKLEKFQAENQKKERQNKEIESQIAALNQEIAAIQSEIDALNSAPRSPEYQTKAQEIEALKRALDDLRAGGADIIEKLRNEIAGIDADITTLESTKLAHESRARGLGRIKELETQQRTLAAEFERLEHELYLLDLYTRQKVFLLDDRINSRFEFARFKLFNVLINGGIEPCCETIYQGIPYSSGLNSGHRVIVGLDIIRTLSQHYGFTPPIWIDNRESITAIPEMVAQMISLFVSAADKTLRVEVL